MASDPHQRPSPESTPPPVLAPRIGRYRILAEIGRGGMGIVYRAVDETLIRQVALKVLDLTRVEQPEIRTRFIREAQAAAGIEHDRVVRIYEVGEEAGRAFIAMQLLEGETLENRLRWQRTLPVEEVLRIGREVADGLAAAHRRKCIHRDIKPSNIWLEKGTGGAKILDFGVAWQDGNPLNLTQSGYAVGTSLYMAPEQADGDADPAVDLFSLGVVLYQMATGHFPYQGSNLRELTHNKRHHDVRPPVDGNRDIPLPLSDLILGLLSATPANRPPGAEAVSAALGQIRPRIPNVLVKSYGQSQNQEFFREVKALVERSRQITLVGTGLNLLWQQDIVEQLVKRAAEPGVCIRVCLGNPYSPHVEDRLIEETMWGIQPPVAKVGIARTVESLLNRCRGLPDPQAFTVRLFEHYPTISTLIFDNEIFAYSYAYRALGNSSPLFHFRDDGSDEPRFYRDHAERVLADAAPAEDVIEAHRNPTFYSEKWIAAAVYLIPRADDELYRFGTGVLGYDIRAQVELPPEASPVPESREFVGGAARYGLHVTLADALFFTHPQALARIRAELEYLGQEFSSFSLTGLDVAQPFHGESSIIALACQDPTGTAEALHHELVARMYRQAVSSNYRSGRTRKRPPSDHPQRVELMKRRYGAPFILGRFEPHFTLCRTYPAHDPAFASLPDRLRAAFRTSGGSEFPVDCLCLVTKLHGDERWAIDSEYHLRL